MTTSSESPVANPSLVDALSAPKPLRLASARTLAAILGVIHGTVDLGSVSAVLRAAAVTDSDLLTPFAVVLGYDLIAFGFQFPLGLVVDRFKAARWALALGMVLTAASLLLVGVSAPATMVVAGLGNALFHLGAGALVLSCSQGRAGPSGVFVAPGALGLGLGMWMGRRSTAPLWPLIVLLLAGLLVATLIRPDRATPSPRAPRAASLTPVVVGGILLALLVSVTVRSFVGFGGCYQCPKTLLIVFGIPIAGFCGKLLGGLISDRIGWLETSVGALLISAPLIALSHGSPYVALPGLLIFQATMPVTLTAVYLLFPKWPATSFGLPCFALVAGAVPTFYPEGKHLFGAVLFLVLIGVSALAVWIGLQLLGVRRGFRGPALAR
jgi:MFS transporter, FSR family, fosmidomycin resistance protein